MNTIQIDEKFPRLTNAPIVEAALEIRTRADASWNEKDVMRELSQRLPDYPKQLPRRFYQGSLQFGAGIEPRHEAEDLGWCGVETRSECQPYIAIFERDRFLLSRLTPYCGWATFHEEAQKLWGIHQELSRPQELQRIGLRFINRIEISGPTMAVDGYLRAAPTPPKGLEEFPCVGFLHQDTFGVSGYPYGVTLRSAIERKGETGVVAGDLIIDVDVFTTQPSVAQELDFGRTLQEMRWLKNKTFFGAITDRAIERFA